GCSSNDCPDARHIAEILTAERDKTEAALLDLSNSVRDASHFLSRYGELAGHLPGRQEAVELFAEEMRRRGLWREPAKEPAS
ncbi:MAG TPA: hypothetical protein VD965_07555, partial [Burkholderiales bacterium]|nr:hypothetical protein [Burkholderiales bacterium]